MLRIAFTRGSSLFSRLLRGDKVARKALLSCKPCLEMLEDRVVPTTLLYAVNNLGDAGQGQQTSPTSWAGDLRYCLTQLNANGLGNTNSMEFYRGVLNPLIGTISLGSPLPTINENVTISQGSPKNNITINANDVFRIFTIPAGVTVTITSSAANPLILMNGDASYGGGIKNAGDLQLTNVVVTQCEAAFSGGAVYNSGNLTVKAGCKFSYSQAELGNGGGIYSSGTQSSVDFDMPNGTTGSIAVTNDNATGGSALGGGIYNGGVFVIGSIGSVKFNLDTAYDGGGLYNAANGSAALTNCTFTSCRATDRGGAMYLVGTNNIGNPSSTRFSNTTVASSCTAGNQGPGVLFEPGALFPTGFAGLTDNADPGGIPVQKS